MTLQKLRDHLRARPFRPFTIYLADGRELKVSHPDFVALAPSGREVSIFLENDEHQIIDLLLVTGIGIEGRPGSQAPQQSAG
jgi:hypothetical protein